MGCKPPKSRIAAYTQLSTEIVKALKLFALFATCLALMSCISHGRPAEAPTPVENPAAKKGVTIALLGATGMVGSYVLSEALSLGYDIRALARTPEKLDTLKDRITIIQGDARDAAAIDALIEGSGIVISALGPVKADGKGAMMISTTATGLIIDAMGTHNIQRYIVVSGAAVEMPGDDRNLTGWLVEQSATIALHDTLKDKQAEYRLLADSPVLWTLVRCPLIDPEPFAHKALVSVKTPPSFRLRAGELARFIIEQIESDEYIGKGPLVGSK